jgi:serine/threonine-protein kinase
MGMTAYSLLSGALALDLPAQANVSQTVKAIFEKPIIPLQRRAPDVPAPVAEIVERALAKDPAQRWATAEAMRVALMQAL